MWNPSAIDSKFADVTTTPEVPPVTLPVVNQVVGFWGSRLNTVVSVVEETTTPVGSLPANVCVMVSPTVKGKPVWLGWRNILKLPKRESTWTSPTYESFTSTWQPLKVPLLTSTVTLVELGTAVIIPNGLSSISDTNVKWDDDNVTPAADTTDKLVAVNETLEVPPVTSPVVTHVAVPKSKNVVSITLEETTTPVGSVPANVCVMVSPTVNATPSWDACVNVLTSLTLVDVFQTPVFRSVKRVASVVEPITTPLALVVTWLIVVPTGNADPLWAKWVNCLPCAIVLPTVNAPELAPLCVIVIILFNTWLSAITGSFTDWAIVVSVLAVFTTVPTAPVPLPVKSWPIASVAEAWVKVTTLLSALAVAPDVTPRISSWGMNQSLSPVTLVIEARNGVAQAVKSLALMVTLGDDWTISDELTNIPDDDVTWIKL